MRHQLAVGCVSLIMMGFVVTSISFAELLFVDNFESDVAGKPPKNWVIGFDGIDDAQVIKDPQRANNLVFSSPTERHDVGGAIYVTGQGEAWTDYYVQWEMLFLKDFYMGIVFRFSDGESFYLLDRRQNTSKLDFWKRQGGWENFGSSEVLDLSVETWFAFQLKVAGADFEVKMKKAKDNTEFDKLDPVLEGDNKNFNKGDFGNYGFVLLDNVVVATDLADFKNPFAVSPNGNLVMTWAHVKQR